MIEVLEDKKAEKLVLLDIQNVSSFADYFIICNGTSDRMLQALADGVREFAKNEYGLIVSIEGEGQDGWLLVDLGDIVVHLFSPDQRDHYKLEQFWERGKRLLNLQ
ncbi:ribosome silencing factor [bacterium]|nr:ribosome silencing factor [bacterium]